MATKPGNLQQIIVAGQKNLKPYNLYKNFKIGDYIKVIMNRVKKVQ